MGAGASQTFVEAADDKEIEITDAPEHLKALASRLAQAHGASEAIICQGLVALEPCVQRRLNRRITKPLDLACLRAFKAEMEGQDVAPDVQAALDALEVVQQQADQALDNPKLNSGMRDTMTELKAEVKNFAELMKPHLEAAEAAGVTIAIENHSSNLINTPDSLKWLAELVPSPHLGIALAPYHLESLGVDAAGHAALIKTLGNRIAMFYAWQHGMGCSKKLPKEQELLQMPGRGKLDFTPILGALKAIRFTGVTSIFMHPVPRGIPILDTAAQCTTEINRARSYLEKCLAKA